MHDIETLNQQVQSRQTPDIDAENELNKKKNALEKIFDYEAEGAFIRARTNYRIDGEKPTKLFCALETQNGVQKYVSQLIKISNNDEFTLTDQKQIELEIHDFYKDLFKCKDNQLNDQSIDQFLGTENCQSIKKLSLSKKK